MFKQILSMIFILPACYASYYQSVSLSNVGSLTFYKNAYTTGNRLEPIPQLQCVGGDACNYAHLIQSIQCVNRGNNEFDNPQWSCSTDISNKFRLGKTVVSCEGFMNSEDKFKLAGSCGLKYELFLTQHSSSFGNFVITFLILFVLIVSGTYIVRHDMRHYNRCGYPHYCVSSAYYSHDPYVQGHIVGSYYGSGITSGDNDSHTTTGHGDTETR